MFIKKLFKHSRIAGTCFVFFILLFVYINYKWGVVATPVLQFGMFSGKHFLSDTQTVYYVKIRDSNISSKSLSAGNRDMIQGYIEWYESYEQQNAAVYKTFEKYWRSAGLTSLATYSKFNPAVSDTVFSGWIKTKIAGMLALPENGIGIYRQHYAWKNDQLTAVDAASKLHFIDAE